MSDLRDIVHRYDVDRQLADIVLDRTAGYPLSAELLSAYDIYRMAELNLKQAIKGCSQEVSNTDGTEISFEVWIDAIESFTFIEE